MTFLICVSKAVRFVAVVLPFFTYVPSVAGRSSLCSIPPVTSFSLPAAIVPLPNAVPHAVKSGSERFVRFDALTSAFVAKLVVVDVLKLSIAVVFAEILVVFVEILDVLF